MSILEGGFVPKSEAESEIAAKEDKHLFPSVFKMGDLNLLDVSDIAESSDDLIQDHVSSTPSTSGVEKEAARDVDLPMISNSLSDYDDYSRLVSDANEPTRVNVANDFLKEKVFDTTGHKTETMYSSVEHFLDHTDNFVDLPDVQDACGSAISRLLGTDILNCSSVSTDIDDLHSPKSLHGQGWTPIDSLSAPISNAIYSYDGLLVYAGFCDGAVGVFDADTLRLPWRIAPTAYIPTVASNNVYPLVTTAHPSEPNQIALGMSEGAVHVVEPSDAELKWGAPPPQENGTLPSIPSNPALSIQTSEPPSR